VCLCTGFVQNFAGLVTTRIFLGFFEGCLFPSMTLFMCNWYTREELGIRVAYLFSKQLHPALIAGMYANCIQSPLLFPGPLAGSLLGQFFTWTVSLGIPDGDGIVYSVYIHKY
jgi:MFS family permease